jgi:hypothetical protein
MYLTAGGSGRAVRGDGGNHVVAEETADKE